MIPAWQVARMRRDRLALSAHERRGDLALPLFAGAATLFFAVGILALALSAMVSIGTPYVADASHIESPQQLISTFSKGGARIYDRNGTLLYQFVDPYAGLRRPVPLTDISPWLVKATVAVEDPTFYTNPGFSPRGLARAGYENFAPWAHNGDVLQGSGGSGITQQLAKNIYIPPDQRLERSISRKLKELAIAVQLTREYPKDQILGWYLNSISYGGIYVGAEAAAQGYFSEHAKDLTLGQAALLAGLPQSPAAYDPVVHPDAARARREEVLRLMVEHGAITQAQAAQAATEPIQLHKEQFNIQAPHFVFGPVFDELKARFGEKAIYNDGLIVTTSLDLRLQNAAQDILNQDIAAHEQATNSHNGAIEAVDPKTGEVLVYLGSRDYFDDSIDGRVDNIRSLNSPGSTLKPFTYMTAFEKGWGTGTGIPDEPFVYHDIGSGKDFLPVNAGKDYQGIATAATGLGNSSNVAAVHTILFAGVPSVVKTLKAVGYTTFEDPSMYGPALTVGGTDIKLEDSVMGYTVLANEGIMRGERTLQQRPSDVRQIDPVTILDVKDSTGKDLYHFDHPVEQRVVPAAATYLVTSILDDGKNTCVTWWCGALKLTNGMPSAVKTGASQPYIDSDNTGDTWALGYTSELVAGVWAGNSDNSPAHDLFSTTIAWQTWNDFMVKAHEIMGVTAKPFTEPPGVVTKVVCWPSGNLATGACPSNHRYTSLFLADVKPAVDTWWHNGQLAIPASFWGNSQGQLVNAVKGGLGNGEQMIGAPGAAATPAAAPAPAPAQQTASNTGSTTTAANGGASIISPGDGGTVSGMISIAGIAQSDHFQSYYLDATAGAVHVVLAMGHAPASGVLATWNTTGVPNGMYTVRLVVQDAQRGTMLSSIRVTVAN